MRDLSSMRGIPSRVGELRMTGWWGRRTDRRTQLGPDLGLIVGGEFLVLLGRRLVLRLARGGRHFFLRRLRQPIAFVADHDGVSSCAELSGSATGSGSGCAVNWALPACAPAVCAGRSSSTFWGTGSGASSG